MRRSQPDDTSSMEDDDASSHEQGIVRRFPRIGSQFQTRISKSTAFTMRPTPERMSVDFPYISEREAESLDHSDSKNIPESKVGPATTNSDFGANLSDKESDRGGVLLHKPGKEMREFSKYIKPFIISTDKQINSTISNEAWIQHMIHLHSIETTGKRSRSSRGGVKRKRVEDEEIMIWNLESILNNIQKSQRKNLSTEILGEEEATALEHFWRSFDGNIDAAQFNLLVELSGGQASKMRKREERERTKRKLKTPSHQTSESWREMYVSSTEPYKRTLLGQLQDDAEMAYAVQASTSATLGEKSHADTNVNLVLEPDDLKGAWRSILACAKSIERQLNNESLGPGDKKPLLSTLLTFVAKAYDLPTPEKCFGTHHVMIEEVSNTIISILNHVKKAQDVHAKIRDKLFNDAEQGINSDDLLKFVETEYSALPIRLEEVEKLYKFRDVVDEWESRLQHVLSSVTEDDVEYEKAVNSLSIAEKMQQEAKSHGYRSRALVELTGRINKAYDLRDKIFKWKCAGVNGKLTTVRTLAGFVKEAKRIKLFSPEIHEIVDYHQLAEEWIDRANIAIRSKISLDELKNLIKRGEDMSLDLSEYVDKLKTRVRIADDWLEALDEIIPFKEDRCTSLKMWKNLETSLKNGIPNGLYELSSEGNRIPVDVVAVKLLQLALDAKNWTTKALKWIPDTAESKKGKLCDLREYLEKASSLRDKLPLSETEREKWKPAGESELAAIVLAADSWAEKNKVFLAGDNRKGDGRSCLSISNLRKIVDEGNIIYANLGNSITKISRVLVQAENWYGSHLPLLEHCGILPKDHAAENTSKALFTTISEMSEAVEAAKMDVSLDLEEAMQLQKILEKTRSWNERVTLIAPRRNKRHSRGSRSKFSLKDLIGLIEEASNLPIDTNESVNRLQDQLNVVEIWRSEASKALNEILIEFSGLKSHIEDVYGEPKDYNIDQISENYDSDEENVNDPRTSGKDEVKEAGEIDNTSDNTSEHVMESGLGVKEDVSESNRGSNSALTVFRLIRELKEDTKDISVNTAEGEIAEILDSASKWCIKSFKYLSTPREVFDKRFFGAFDRFVAEGEELCALSRNSEMYSTFLDGLSQKLFYAWGVIVEEQLVRLHILKKEREKFEAWCKRASQILSDQKNLTAERLADLAKSSRNFPANRDLVSKIRGLSVKVSKWTEEARKLFESGEKLDFQDARFLVETGEKLKVQTEELKKLKAEIKAARNWSNRASECNEHGAMDVATVQQLIEDHNNLLIEMPDELEALQEATVGYCICRRPYEGFMIGCDHCEEWYHGSCIGISESKADKVEKFTCVRCSTKIIFKNSASAAVGIVKKWTCSKDLKKARQTEFQKFQRKDRKEKKDIEKFSEQINNLQDCLSKLKQNDKPSEETKNNTESNLMSPGDVVLGLQSIDQQSEDQPAQPDDPPAKKVSTGTDELTKIQSGESPIAPNAMTTVNVTENAESSASKAQQEAETAKEAEKEALSGNACQSVPLSEGEILSQIEKAKTSLQLSKDRLKKVMDQSRQKTLDEAKEDKYAMILRYWCLKVRSEVLAPSKEEQSDKSRPPVSGPMSSVMMALIAEAESLGIRHLSDIEKMVCAFRTICWSFSAMHVLRRKPDVSEVRRLVLEVPTVKLSAEKALRTLKFMSNRASQLQSKFQKALNSKKAVSKPTNISFLKDFQSGIRDCPVSIPEEDILRVVIEDGKIPDRKLLEDRVEKLKARRLIHSSAAVSPHAPDPIEQWPPFGLEQSPSAIEAFGSTCLAIPLEKLPNLVPTEGYEESSNSIHGSSGTVLACSESSDRTSSPFAPSENASTESPKSCNENPSTTSQTGNSQPGPESGGERVATVEVSHDRDQPTEGPPITNGSSNGSHEGQPQSVGASSPNVTANSGDQPDSLSKQRVPAHQCKDSNTLKKACESEIEKTSKDVTDIASALVPTVASNNDIGLASLETHSEDKTGTVDAPNPIKISTGLIGGEAESDRKVQPSLHGLPTTGHATQCGVPDQNLDSQKDDSRGLGGSTPPPTSSPPDIKLETSPKVEADQGVPSHSQTVLTTESTFHQTGEATETSHRNQNPSLDIHPSNQTQPVDMHISNGNSSQHNQVGVDHDVTGHVGRGDCQNHPTESKNKNNSSTVPNLPPKKRIKLSSHLEDEAKTP